MKFPELTHTQTSFYNERLEDFTKYSLSISYSVKFKNDLLQLKSSSKKLHGYMHKITI